jgi:hypothetical protein
MRTLKTLIKSYYPSSVLSVRLMIRRQSKSKKDSSKRSLFVESSVKDPSITVLRAHEREHLTSTYIYVHQSFLLYLVSLIVSVSFACIRFILWRKDEQVSRSITSSILFFICKSCWRWRHRWNYFTHSK